MEKAERARAKNRTDEAIVHFEQAILIDPEFVTARNNLGALYLRLAKLEPAIAQLEEAAKVTSKWAFAIGARRSLKPLALLD